MLEFLENTIPEISTLIVIISALMTGIKSLWKPDNKRLYLIPAGLFSAAGVAVLLQIAGAWELSSWILLSFMVLGSEVWLQIDVFETIHNFFKKDEVQKPLKDLIKEKLEERDL